MSIVRRALDHLTGVLGYDCTGKPLRQGDLVEPAPHLTEDQVTDSARCQMTVLRRPGAHEGFMGNGEKAEIILLNPEGMELVALFARSLRKIPPNELEARWENVERLTGWRPSEVRESGVPA